MAKQKPTNETDTIQPFQGTEDFQPLAVVDDQDAPIFVDEEEDTTALVPFAPTSVQTVEGFQVTPNMTNDQKEEMYESISTYIGVIPLTVDQFIGQWLVCKGCVVQPIQSETTDEESGEVSMKKWVKPLFKIIHPEHKSEVIIGGGGKYGLEFARNMTSLFGPGDWQKWKMIKVTQEARQGSDGSPRRLYRFNFKRYTEGEK
jgi:hypothetical protein